MKYRKEQLDAIVTEAQEIRDRVMSAEFTDSVTLYDSAARLADVVARLAALTPIEETPA